MPRSREGSPFTGLGPVFMKEFADHLSSARMMVLMLFVIVFGALPVGLSLQELRNVIRVMGHDNCLRQHPVRTRIRGVADQVGRPAEQLFLTDQGGELRAQRFRGAPGDEPEPTRPRPPVTRPRDR